MRLAPLSVAAALLGMALLAAPRARAQAPQHGADIVELKNGGMVRGTVVEVEPGKHVLIVVDATGERRLLAWDEVARVARGAASEPARAPAVPGVPAARAAERGPDKGLVHLRFRADDPRVRLLRATAAGHEPVCAAPCDRAVDGRHGEEFLFAGPGITPSDTFRLLARSGELHMKVDAGSKGWRTAGIVGFGAGIAVGWLGTALWSAGAAGEWIDDGRHHVLTRGEQRALKNAGGTGMVLGAALIAAGLWAIFANDTEFAVVER